MPNQTSQTGWKAGLPRGPYHQSNHQIPSEIHEPLLKIAQLGYDADDLKAYYLMALAQNQNHFLSTRGRSAATPLVHPPTITTGVNRLSSISAARMEVQTDSTLSRLPDLTLIPMEIDAPPAQRPEGCDNDATVADQQSPESPVGLSSGHVDTNGRCASLESLTGTGNDTSIKKESQNDRPPTPSQSRAQPQASWGFQGQENNASPDPVIPMLAKSASSDPELKALMKVVASGNATQDQLRVFQGHIDEVTKIINERR